MRQLNWFSLGVAVAAVVALWDLLRTPSSGAFIGTTTFPVVVVSALAILSAVHVALSLRAAPPARNDGSLPTGSAMPRVVGLVLLTALFIALLPWLGYYVASIAYCVGACGLFGNRRPVPVLLLSVLLPAALLLFFERYMIVLLPSAAFLR